MFNSQTRKLLVITLSSLGILATAASARAGDFEDFQKQAKAEKKATIVRLIDQKAICIVSLEFIAKESFMGQEQKNEMAAPAVMVSADGLLLTANSRLQGLMTMGMRMMGGMMGGMMGNMPPPQSEAEDIKIIIGEDSEEYEAKLVARDSDLDLAWVQITDTKGKSFAYVDFNDAVTLEVGDTYYSITRMGERFDRVPVVTSSSVTAVLESPRPLLVGSSTMSWGGPIFNADGKVAGFLITQPPEPGEEGPTSLESLGNIASFILPAKKVASALVQAREIAKKQAAEAPEED